MFFVSISNLLMSSIILFLILFFWTRTRNQFVVPVVMDVIFFFAAYKVTAYLFLPTWYRMIDGYQHELNDGIDLTNLAFVYAIECVSYAVWLLAIYIITGALNRRRKHMGMVHDLRCAEAGRSQALLIVITLGAIIYYFVQLGYIDNSAVDSVFIFFGPLLSYGGMVLGPYLLVMKQRKHQILFRGCGLILSAQILIGLSTRGVFVYMIIWIIFLVFFARKSRIVRLVTVASFLLSVIFYIAMGGLPQFSISDVAGERAIVTDVSTEKAGDRTALEEISWRFGASTRFSTAFIVMYNRGDGAGINPIKNSLLGFMPRKFWPDKPYPSTLNGDDVYSQGMYLIDREILGYERGSMCEFCTGAHFYWEFGFMGVIVLSAISGIYITLCAHYFVKMGSMALPLMVVIFKPWGYVEPKIWVSEIAFQLYTIIIPLLVLWYLLGAYRLLRVTNKSQRI